MTLNEIWNAKFSGRWGCKFAPQDVEAAKKAYAELTDPKEKAEAFHAFDMKGVSLSDSPPPAVPAVFCGDWDDEKYEGYDSGVRWNGWACPLMNKEQVLRMVKAQEKLGPEVAVLRMEGNILVYTYNKGEKDEEIELVEPAKVMTTEGEKELYGVGFSWTWQIIEDNDDEQED